MNKDQTATSVFIKKSIEIHGDKYDYSKVVYFGALQKVCIVCQDHGEFYQVPKYHLSGKGCFKCSYKRRYDNLTLGKERFIDKSIKIHGHKYDYSKVDYKNSKTKVCIVCTKLDELTGEIHNEFWQTPYSHLSGATCPKCTGHFMNLEIFIQKARVIHKNKYDYLKVQYLGIKEKVIIICPEHGEFLQSPDSHLRGQRCPKCSNVYQPYTDEWIENAKIVHDNRYDYSKVVYVNNRTKICIKCKEHGEFWQTPANHIKGKNCPKCTGHFLDKNFFLQKAKEIYKDKQGNPLYDYSLVDYYDSSTLVSIICHKKDPLAGREHGVFSKTPNKHLSGQGCPICGNETGGLKNRLTKEQFLKRAQPNKFNYLTEYKTAKSKIHIQCKKCNTSFWQEAYSHLSGCGCPFCNESKLEKKVTKYLNEHNIRYEKQKKFVWLRRQSLDFYLPDYKIAVECQGIQHFEPNNFFGGNKGLAEIVKRDNRKLKLCLANDIEMMYVIDNEKFLERKYHSDKLKPFSDNVNYKIVHIDHFENWINRVFIISQLFFNGEAQ